MLSFLSITVLGCGEVPVRVCVPAIVLRHSVGMLEYKNNCYIILHSSSVCIWTNSYFLIFQNYYEKQKHETHFVRQRTMIK
jgi:hypothetical protein